MCRESTEEVSTWKVINLMRVIGAFIGWIMVAMAPEDDQTAGNILSMSMIKAGPI